MKRLITLFFIVVALLTINLQKASSQTYCTPSWTNTGSNWQIGTDRVQIGSINNTSGCPTNVANYMDYTSMSTSILQGGTVSYSVLVGNSNSTWFCIYVDYNNDGTFNTTNELVASSNNVSAGGTYSGSFTVPITTPSGNKRMRVISDYGGMGVAPSPCGVNNYAGDCEDYILRVMPLAGLDASLASIDSPVVFSVGSNKLVVTYMNSKADTIRKVQLGYQLGTNTPVNVPNIIYKLGPMQSKQYKFATPINLPSTGSYNIKVWVTRPNDSFPDNDRTNDTLKKTICTGMVGTYSVGPTGNFTSFTAAITAVNNCGIAGPIIFNVQPGTYTERLIIPYIIGVDATKTITFRGAGKTSTYLSYSGSTNSNQSTVYLNGARYINFENMTIQNLGSTYARAFFFSNQANYNRISNCTVSVNTSYTGGWTTAIESGSNEATYPSYGNNANNNIIENCDIIGGYYGVTFCGSGTSSVCTGNIFRGNNFSGQYYSAFYFYYMGNTTLQRNLIDIGTRYNSAYGVYAYYCTHSIYDGNIVKPGQYGIYTYYENYYFTGDSTVYVNNMFYGFKNTTYQNAITCYIYNYGIRIYNNTFRMDGSYANNYNYSAIYFYNYVYNLKVRNNIFYTTSGTMFMTFYPGYPNGNLAVIESNDYYYPTGTNYRFFNNGIYYTDLTNWKTSIDGIVSPHDTKSFDNVDPNFVSATDIHLKQQWTPLKASGTWLQWDVDGNSRCKYETTLGADEVLSGGMKPKAGFIAQDSICLGSPFTFLNLAGPTEPKGHKWFVNGAYQANTLNFSYAFNMPGKDTITLVTENCYGIDTFKKIITIGTSNIKPEADFVSNKNEGEIYDYINLFDLSRNCPSSWHWEIYPDSIYDLSVGGAWMPTYEFKPGVFDTTENTTVWFNYPGKYRVCLVARNAKGVDTVCKSDYININATGVMCMWPLEQNTLKGTVHDDLSGPGYQKPSATTTCGLFINTCADTLVFTLTEFDVKTGDYLKIFQGSNNTGIPLWNRVNFPNGVGNGRTINDVGFQKEFTSSSGKIYLEWTRIGGTPTTLTGGFIGKWAGKLGNKPPPVASFTCPDTVCMNVPVIFENKSTGSGNSYVWKLDNSGNSSTLENPSYTYTSVGYQTVKLEVTNCTGSDYFNRQIYVYQPNKAPKANFYADIRFPVAGFDNVTLMDSSIGCAESYQWSITPATYTPLLGFPSTANPKVRFDSTGCYTIKLIVGYNGKYDSIKKICYIKAIRYCTPAVTNLNTDVGISRVKFGSIDNSTPIGVDAYTDYSNTQSTYLDILGTYTLSVSRNSTFNSMNRKAWIDFNMDGDFDDAGELIGSESMTQTLIWNLGITIPITVSPGATRLRVGTSLSNMPNDPCGPNLFGEYEDYRIILRPDGTAPIITLKGLNNVYIGQCAPSYVDSGAVAIDNIDGNISSKIVTTNNLDLSKAGSYWYRYNVKDTKGNKATEVERIITVQPDNVAPNLPLHGNVADTVWVDSTWTDAGYLANDACSGIKNVTTIGTVDKAKVGKYEITYTATDNAGNTTVKKRTVNVVDKIFPQISLKGLSSVTVPVFGIYTESGS